MAKIDTDGLIEVKELAALRTSFGAKVATEQGIRTQIRQLESKVKTSEQIGFEVVRIASAVLIRIIDKELLDFQKKFNEWRLENSK